MDRYSSVAKRNKIIVANTDNGIKIINSTRDFKLKFYVKLDEIKDN